MPAYCQLFRTNGKKVLYDRRWKWDYLKMDEHILLDQSFMYTSGCRIDVTNCCPLRGIENKFVPICSIHSGTWVSAMKMSFFIYVLSHYSLHGVLKVFNVVVFSSTVGADPLRDHGPGWVTPTAPEAARGGAPGTGGAAAVVLSMTVSSICWSVEAFLCVISSRLFPLFVNNWTQCLKVF